MLIGVALFGHLIMNKKKIYIAYGAWLFFVINAFLMPCQTTTYKNGLAFFAYVSHSPLMMLIFCVAVGGALFYKGFVCDDVARIWTFLFGGAVMCSIIYTLFQF